MWNLESIFADPIDLRNNTGAYSVIWLYLVTLSQNSAFRNEKENFCEEIASSVIELKQG